MSMPRLWPESPGIRRTGWTVAGLGLLLAGLAGMAPAPKDDVTARLGSITVSATGLRPGPAGTLTASMRASTSGQASDQLDAAIAAGGAVVAVYHQRVAVGELPDLAGCGDDNPPPGVVSHWLHYGPLLVPGRASASGPPAKATLTVNTGGQVPPGGKVAVTLYFAAGGQITLDLPVRRA